MGGRKHLNQLRLDHLYLPQQMLTVCRKCSKPVALDLPHIHAYLRDGMEVPYHLKCFTQSFDDVDTPGVDNCIVPGVESAIVEQGERGKLLCGICEEYIRNTDECHLHTWEEIVEENRFVKGIKERVLALHDRCVSERPGWSGGNDTTPSIPLRALVAPLPYRPEDYGPKRK